MRRRDAGAMLAALVTGAMLVSPAVAADRSPAAPTSAPHGTTVLTQGTGTFRDNLQLLTGSTTELIYAATPGLTDATDPLEPALADADAELLARSKAARMVDLGVMPRDVGWSTQGHLLAAVRRRTRTVDLWDLTSGHHSTFRLPAADLAIGATPDGVAYLDGATIRFHDVGTGTTADWGTPFSGTPPTSIATDQTQLVVGDDTGDVAVMSYATPGRYTMLNTAGSTTTATCFSIDSAGAACSIGGDVDFLPFSGDAPTVGNACGPVGLALSGTTVMWTEECSDVSHVHSITGGGTEESSPQTVDFGLVAAYGEGVVLGPQGAPYHVLGATSAERIKSLFIARRSHETAAGFGLSPSSVSYISDRRTKHDPTQLREVRRTRVKATARRVSVGAASTIGGRVGPDQVQPSRDPRRYPTITAFDADGGVAAYIVSGVTDGSFTSRVRVSTGAHTGTLASTKQFFPSTVQVSGHRVLYYPNGYRNDVAVYDVRTHHTQHLLGHHLPLTVALAGSHLAYATGKGHIYWRNLKTGRTQTVFNAKEAHRGPITLVANRTWVAWDLAQGSGPFGVGPTIDGAKRMVKGGKYIALLHRVYGIDKDGLLLRSTPTDNFVMMTWFHPFSGGLHPLLSRRPYDELPQLAGHALAWVSVDGDLKVAPYSPTRH